MAILGAVIFMVSGISGADEKVKGNVADLAWLTGHWRQESPNGFSEETFSSPAGGLLIETAREVSGGKTLFFEFVRFVQSGETISFLAMPNASAKPPLALKEVGKNKVVFKNSVQEFPSTISYEINPRTDELLTQVAGTRNGESVIFESRYKRAILGQ
jgi:hypothetical protein